MILWEFDMWSSLFLIGIHGMGLKEEGMILKWLKFNYRYFILYMFLRCIGLLYALKMFQSQFVFNT